MKHPYIGLPTYQFWKKEAGIQDGTLLDPVSSPPFSISASDRIVTAGSCFAQHVARYMSESGFNHHITEQAHPIIPPKLATKHNYGMFSARYGNIYTAKQLKQLLERAYGAFTPQVKSWKARTSEGVVDPFRPQIQPGGFVSEAELEADRASHFSSIRRAIEEMDVFVFTLGLTEAWVDTRDDAVFPIAPGIAGGEYDPETVAFKNYNDTEVYEDLIAALSFIREKRPDIKIILTVSPVPLNATYEDRHVLVSTVLSKAILRIAADKCAKHLNNCVYFPSYDIITSPHVRGKYFDVDCREVLPAGVNHVMRLFLRHFTDANQQDFVDTTKRELQRSKSETHMQEMQEKMDVLCDEAAIDNE